MYDQLMQQMAARTGVSSRFVNRYKQDQWRFVGYSVLSKVTIILFALMVIVCNDRISVNA